MRLETVLHVCFALGFDGLDLDWEYPAHRGSPPEDKDRFTTLCRELKNVYKEKGLLLTAAVAAAPSKASNAYDIFAISQELDFINLMAYDIYGGWDASCLLYTSPSPRDRG